jgi:general secretion pathway protein A
VSINYLKKTTSLVVEETLTYEPHFGLVEKPFSLNADARFVYESAAYASTRDRLVAGIRRREGLNVLTGEIGTGKTTLCRDVIEELGRKTYSSIVPDPFASREDLLKMLLIEFGVLSVDDVKSGRLQAATRSELSYPLYDFLRSLVPLQAYAVLIIDEAQNLASQLLEEIRVLSDLEGPEKLLQLVLVGQPELRDQLKDPAMRQVDQRVSVRCSLQPLDRDAVPAYIAHRLTVAGGGSDPVEFTSDALDLLFRASRGNPRVINLLVDKSLHRGHVDRTWIIPPPIVAAALDDLGYTDLAPSSDVSTAVTLAPSSSSTALPPELFLPEVPDLEAPVPGRTAPDETDPGPHFLLEEAYGRSGRDTRQAPDEGRRTRRRALLAIAVLAVAVALGLNEWSLAGPERMRSQLPAVADPLAPAIGAGAAPVIAPPEYFAPAGR